MTATRSLRVSQSALAGAVAVLWGAACADLHGPSDERHEAPSTEVSLILSNPVSSAAAAGAGLSFSGSPTSADIVYASLVPGSVPNGERVVIRNRETGALATAEMMDGGFDPVPVAAVAGDTLDVRIEVAGGGSLEFFAVVSSSRAPIVVRTDPPPGKRDVPLNAAMLLVFSEPINAATVTSSSVQLLLDGAPVAGALDMGDDANLTVTFTPAEPLVPGVEYTLRVTQAIEDLDGDALEAPHTSTFTTSAQPPLLPAAIAFVSDRSGADHIYVANADGSEVTRVTEGSQPAWSRDGRKIAFHRQASSSGPGGIYVMDYDGSAVRYVGPGGSPAWSPDGRIAFVLMYSHNQTAGFGLYAMNADGSGVTRLFEAVTVLTSWGAPGTWLPNYQIGGPTWSPDGRSIWFQAQALAFDPDWDNRLRLGIADADGSNPREVEVEELRRLWHWSGPGWSPDGSTVAVITNPGPWETCDGWLGCQPGPGFNRGSVIYGYDVSSGVDFANPRVIYTDRAFRAWDPDWSPDGSHVVFAADFSPQDGLGRGRRRIYTVSLETGTVRQLIPDAIDPAVANYGDWGAVWSRASR